jgi:hypothetical protein
VLTSAFTTQTTEFKSSDSSGGNEGLDAGAIAGISVAVAALVVFIIL